MIVYKITNQINKKVYIGQTVYNIRKRWREHKNLGKSNHCSLLKRAIAKYGPDNFIIEEVCKVETMEELNNMEKYYIHQYDSIKLGYNIESGGNNRRMSEKVKKHLSNIKKGKTFSEEHRKNMSNAGKGRKQDIAQIEKRKETLKNLRNNGLLKPAMNNKSIVQLTLDGRFLNEFISTKQAFISLEKKQTGTISEVLHNKRNEAFGCLWVFKEEFLNDSYKKRLIQIPRVIQKAINNQFIAEFSSLEEASSLTKIDIRYIRRVCEGNRRSSLGYIWEYKV